MSLVYVDNFKQTWRWTSVNVTRREQKSFEDRWKSRETALRKTPAPWSAKMGRSDGNVSSARKVLPANCRQVSLLKLSSGLAEVCSTSWSPQRYLGCLLRSGYCASARARVMLHERRLNDCHEFQESRVSISVSRVSGLTYTPTDTNTHINHVCRWVGNVTAFPFAQLVLCLFVWDLAHSLYLAESFLSLSLLHAFVHFHWRGSGAEGCLMRLFDRGMCSVKPRYMCALHVQGRALPYWYTFYAKYGARGAEGWRDWRMKHMDNRRGSPWLLVLWQAALQTDGKHGDMPHTDTPHNKQVPSLKPMCQRQL